MTVHTDELLRKAAELFEVRLDDVLSTSRRSVIADTRAALCWVLLRCGEHRTMRDVATLLRLRDRKSIYNGLQRAEQLVRTSPTFRRRLRALQLVADPELSRGIAVPGIPDSWAQWATRERGIFVQCA